MSKVVLVKIDSYDREQVYIALQKGLGELGGLGCFVKPGEKILVNPNFLTAGDESRAIATNPAVIEAVLRAVKDEGIQQCKFGDSPGTNNSEAVMKSLNIPKNLQGAEFTPMNKEVQIAFQEGRHCREFYFCSEVQWADGIISVCKMKTHALERITCAVKNPYGLVCGFRKAQGHVSYPTDTAFAGMLTDIHRCVDIRLHICDAIVAMEGNGPSGGTPTPMNLLMISADPVALDTVFCYLVNLNPSLVPTNVVGQMAGIGTMEEKDIEILMVDEDVKKLSSSELLEKYGNKNFNVSRKNKMKFNLLSGYSGFMRRFSPRPVIEGDKCVKCGVCVNHCPVPGKAVDFKKGRENIPVYDYKKCIRCYCCQEMCPQSAIRKSNDKNNNKNNNNK